MVYKGGLLDFGLAVHENTHILTRLNWGDSSSFLLEGCGKYTEALATDKDKNHSQVIRYLKDGKLFPLEEMVLFELGPAGLKTEIGYPAAGSFVGFVIEKYGLELLKKAYNLDARPLEQKEKEDTWKEAFKTSVKELEKEWLEWLVKKYSLEQADIQRHLEKAAKKTEVKALDLVLLEAYVGKYKISNMTLTVSREGSRLFLEVPGMNKMELVPESETQFSFKAMDGRVIFNKNEKNEVAAIVFQTSQGEMRGEKIKERARIVSFMPAFFEFWEKAKDEPLDKKMALWDSLFESRYSDFYREVIYQGFNPEDFSKIREGKLSAFLSSLKAEDVQKMKAREGEIQRLIPEAVRELLKLLPEEKGTTTHYLIPSLNTSTGAARPYHGEMIIFYGLELLGQVENPEALKADIAHETFHVLHYRRIAPSVFQKAGPKADMFTAIGKDALIFLAFLEGLAVQATEKVYPGAHRPGIIEKNIPKYEQNFAALAEMFLADSENFTFQKYQKYFFDPYEDPIVPNKFGYWLGYKAVQGLAQTHSLQEMINWTPENAKKLVREEILKLLSQAKKPTGTS
jgi:hypothetical protein